jgi:hypothetical protein
LSYDSTGFRRRTCNATQTEKTKSQGKYLLRAKVGVLPYSLSFLKVVSKYFDSDLCLAKIKVDERFKEIAFDERNRRLTVMSFDRVLYFFDIPQ